MADTITVLYYDIVNTKWVQLKTREVNPEFNAANATTPTNKPYDYVGGNPVLGCEIHDVVGAPLQCQITLNNRQSNPRKTFVEPNPDNYTFGEDPLVNSQLGQFHNLLNEHTDIIVHEANTFMTLFIGKIYETDETYDISAGSLILLTCRDALEIVARNSFSSLSADNGNLRLTSVNPVPVDDVTRGGFLRFARNKLDIIRNIFLQSGGENIEIPGVANTYGTGVTSDKIDHDVNNSPNYLEFSVAAINAIKKSDDEDYGREDLRLITSSPLKRIQQIAENQEWEDNALANRKRFGWSFHLDATRTHPIHDGAEATIKPKQDFVYYRRGYNPTAEPLTKGLVVKYATSQLNEPDTLGTTDRTRNMFQDGFEFKGYGTSTYTHIELLHKGETEAEPDWDGSTTTASNPIILSPDATELRWTTANGMLANESEWQGSIHIPTIRDKDVDKDNRRTHRWGGTYDLYESLGVTGKNLEKWTREEFAIIWVKPNDGASSLENFSINLDDTSQDLATGPRAANDRKRRSFKQVSSLHTWPKNSTNQGFYAKDNVTKTWMGNVQRQGQDEEGNYFLILSNPQHDILMIMDENDTLYERSHYWDHPNNSATAAMIAGASCRLAADGYPARRMGKRTLKLGNTSTILKNSYDEMRNMVENHFLKGNNKLAKRMRKGLFTLKDYPHVRWAGTAGLLSSGTSLSLDQTSLALGGQPVASGITPSTPYGMRRGCSMVKSGTSSGALTGNNKAVGYISSTTATAVVGSLYQVNTLAESSPTYVPWSAGDIYNIYVPYRAGMSIRCENLISGVNGDFLITEIKYVWNNGRVGTEIEVVGINDEVVFKGRAALDTDDEIPQLYELEDKRVVNAAVLAANAYTATGVYWWHDHELWETPHISAADKKDYNTFSWSGGQVRLNSSGDLYKFLAGDTDAALTAAGYTVTSGTYINNPMQAYRQYVLFLDTAEEPNEYGYYTVRIDELTHEAATGYTRNDTFIELVYLTTGEDVNLGSKTIGLPGTNFYSVSLDFPNGMPELQFMAAFNNVWGLSNSLLSAARSIQPGSITAAIMRKGARPFGSNLTFEAYQNTYNNAQWHDGSNGNATISFADPGTASNITVLAGNSVGSGSGDQAYTFLAGNTYYAYMIPDTDSKPHFTTDYAVAVTDDAFIVCIIAIDADTSQKSPTFLPIHSKVPTLSAVAIAADAITATAIKALTVDVTHLNVGSGSNQIAGLTSAGSLNLTSIGSGTLDNIGDGSTYGKLRVNNINAGNLDFSSSNIANKNLDNLPNGSTYGRIRDRDLTDGDIDFNNANYLNKTLNYINETSTRKHVSANQRDGGGRGYAGLNTNNRVSQNIVAAATSHGENVTAYFYGGTSDSPSNLLLINAAGFASYAGVTGAYPSFTLPTYATFQVLTSNGQAQFGSNTVIADSTGLKVYSAATSGTLRTWLKSNSGMAVSSGYSGGMWFQNLAGGSAGTVYASITSGSGTNSTYGHTSNNTALALASSYVDIILNSAQDVYLRPKTGGTYEKEGYVKVGDRPIVFMDQDAASPSNSLHLSTMDFVGFWKKAGAISYSTVYRLPWRTSSTSPTDGQVLAIDGIAKEMDGTVLYGTVGVPSNPYVFDLKWVDAGSVSSPLRLANGAYNAPTYSFTNYTNAGMYYGVSGVGISHAGSTICRFTSEYSYNYKKVYITDVPDITSGGNYVKNVAGVISELTSTERAKMDIQSIAIDTSKIYALEPKSFRYRAQQVNEDGSNVVDEDGIKYYTDVPAAGIDSPLQFGMIAEEVYDHLPELVSLNINTNQPIGLDYPLLSVLLLAELKKLKARIDVLEGN